VGALIKKDGIAPVVLPPAQAEKDVLHELKVWAYVSTKI